MLLLTVQTGSRNFFTFLCIYFVHGRQRNKQTFFHLHDKCLNEGLSYTQYMLAYLEKHMYSWRARKLKMAKGGNKQL